MKAITYDSYGSSDGLRLTELDKPIPSEDQVLIKVHAVSINGSDKEHLVGKPLYSRMGGLFKPGNKVLGSDIAGRVEEVGTKHTEFKIGDEVFGELANYHGGLAEYVCTDARYFALKPASLTFEQAAAIPQAGVIALNGIIKAGNVQAGQKVLINGAGGSGGSFAIQIAKHLDAEVTAVDNKYKQAFMRSLGADHVIDYQEESFSKMGIQYDLILDLVASRSVFDLQRALAVHGVYYFVGGNVGVIFQVLALSALLGLTTKKTLKLLAVPQSKEDLLAVLELCEAGVIFPVIDQQFPLERAPEAFAYMLAGKAKGKLIITMPQ